MKKSMIVTVFILVLAFSAGAKVRRLGYPGTALSGTDYTGLQLVINASSAGDTVYVSPGSWSSAFLSKRLVFIGPGSNQGNAGLQNIMGKCTMTITLGNKYYNNGVTAPNDSSIFEGLDGLSFYSDDTTVTNKFVIQRCVVSFTFGGDYGNTSALNSFSITQSIISSMGTGYGPYGSFINLYVSNCIINTIYNNLLGLSGLFVNNIFLNGSYNFANGSCTMRNNIFLDASSITGNSGLTYFNNISTKQDIPATNNNITGVSNSSIFVGYPTQGSYSSDKRFTIAAGSVALTAADDGKQCGIFGGANPYRLNCIPPIPAIFYLSAPSTTATTNPYTLIFSARSNN